MLAGTNQLFDLAASSPVPFAPHHGTYGDSTTRIPHPEVYMDYVRSPFFILNYIG
jgi:hypothetical protein